MSSDAKKQEHVVQLLAPLLPLWRSAALSGAAAAADAAVLQVVAGGEGVVVESAYGVRPVAPQPGAAAGLEWTPALQQQVREAMAPWAAAGAGAGVAPARGARWVELPDGGCARWVGESLVVRWAPQPGPAKLAALVQAGWLSELAARCLLGALALGRNVLLVGPWAASAELTVALVGAEAHKPAWVGPAGEPAPAGWSRLRSGAQRRWLLPDRLALLGAWRPAALLKVLEAGGAAVGWLEARRLDQALMRLESDVARGGAARRPGGGGAADQALLQVLAALDVVVVVGPSEAGPRVRQIAELTVAPEGYRPRLLFAAGRVGRALAPAGAPAGASLAGGVLMPVAVPSFVEELEALGDGLLAADLRHGAPVASAPFVASAGAGVGSVAGAAAAGLPVGGGATASAAVAGGEGAAVGAGFGVGVGASAGVVGRAPVVSRGAAPGMDPGWELDQLGQEEAMAAQLTGAAADAAPEGAAEAAVMAARFGLGPPPPPRPVAPPLHGKVPDAGRKP